MSGKRLVLSAHARWRAERRGIDETTVLEVAAAPEQVLPVRPGREIRQSRRDDPARGRQFVVRVVVETGAEADTVVTVYRSSKVDKYWRIP
jgi:hypothetical protein